MPRAPRSRTQRIRRATSRRRSQWSATSSASSRLASASDGYSVVFHWSESYDAPVGDGVLVVFEHDHAARPDGEARIALVSASDKRSGPRHVTWLNRIDVRVAAG